MDSADSPVAWDETHTQELSLRSDLTFSWSNVHNLFYMSFCVDVYNKKVEEDEDETEEGKEDTCAISCLNSVIVWFRYARTLIGVAMVSLFRSTT